MNTTIDLDEIETLETDSYTSTIDPDTLIDNDADTIGVVNSKIVKENLKDVLDELTARERAVVDYRFGLSDGFPRTLKDVGFQFGVGSERIRQMECKAFRKLRRPDRLRKVETF